jgi:TolB-like protein
LIPCLELSGASAGLVATAHREALERKDRELRQRRDRLDEAFVYQGTIERGLRVLVSAELVDEIGR